MRRIEDEFTNETLTATQKHSRRKTKLGICSVGGCKEKPEINQESGKTYSKCFAHREVVNRYNRERLERLKNLT